jgi:predicted NACHT family NTPase
VQSFNLEQIRSFIYKWYLETEKIRRFGDESSEIEEQAKQQAEDLINRIRNSSPLAAMAVNPLLLTMISTVHHKLSLKKKSLPEKRVELYKEMCEVLLEKRQEDKGIPDRLQVQDKKFVLQVLALKLMKQETTEFKLDDGVGWIQKQFATVFRNKEESKKFIEYIRDIGLLVENEEQCYQFAHFSFQEYLAACQINKTNQESLLIEKLSSSWWEETILWYAALRSDVTTLVRAIDTMRKRDYWGKVANLSLLIFGYRDYRVVRDFNVMRGLRNVGMWDRLVEDNRLRVLASRLRGRQRS